MPESVEIDSKKLKAAYDDLDSLVRVVKGRAKAARNETPIPLPSLDGDFNGLVSWLEDQKPELKTRLDLAVLLDTKGTGHATYQVDQDTLDNTKTLLGDALAERGMDLHAGGDAKQVRAYNEILATYAGDGKVMSPMFQKLGPENTLRVLSNVGQASVPPMSEDVEAKKRLMDLYRQGLGAASKEPGFPHESFADGLVKAATKDPEDYVGRGTTGYGLTSALSVLMYNAHFSDSFAKDLALGLDKYERVDHKGQDHLWTNRPDAMGTDFLWDQMLPSDAAPQATTDPLIAMNTMLANSPEAALDFFDDNERQKYYIKDRSWQGDGYQSLSHVLDVASTDPDIIKGPHAKDAAELAGATVNLLSQRRGSLTDMSTLIEDMRGDSAKNFAHILGTYMVGADVVVNGLGGIDDAKAGDDLSEAADIPLDAFGKVGNIPLFDKAALAKFGVLAVSSEDGMLELRNATNRYESQKLSSLANLIKHPRDGFDAREALHGAIGENAHLDGFFLKANGDMAIAEGKEKDEAVGKWIDMGETAVGMIPVPGVDKMAEGVGKEMINMAVDDGKSAGVDGLKEKLAHYEKNAVKKSNNDVDDAVRQQQFLTATTLYENGLANHPDQVEKSPLFKDGQMLTYAQFRQLHDAPQAEALGTLYGGRQGVGNYWDANDYKESLKNEFGDYFG
ncbi:hypothetical protein E0H75_29625 [Kribbella capetownensis]|uniref:Uncharacterized protein n=1 Tax=Kribbella capetownensis TaxID=1572659 RepID=A0A4R0JJF8_9ACTN|nr:DUF6571 family protein [Kribbella capetownensis]TCC45874.1 hypothetical protein E0H75_29625 [Kribbella capetownensis]